MRFHYVQVPPARQHRPFVPVRIRGPHGWSEPIAAIISSGSDVTVFPQEDAELLGIDLTALPEEEALLDNSLAIRYRPAPVRIKVADGAGEWCEWDTTVGFTAFPLDNPLLGHRWFLESFVTILIGDAEQVILTPDGTFSGSHHVP